jgi:hypothetical protein
MELLYEDKNRLYVARFLRGERNIRPYKKNLGRLTFITPFLSKNQEKRR